MRLLSVQDALLFRFRLIIPAFFRNFFDLKYALEDILGREVDLLEEHAIRNHYLKENIEQTKALIYG